MSLRTIVCILFAVKLVDANVVGSCFTPDQHKGNCVKLRTCPKLLEMFNNRNESDHMMRLYLSLSQCGFSDGEPQVCCKEPVLVNPTVTRIDGEGDMLQFDVLPKPGECGAFAENQIRIGNQTALDEHLWLALLEYTKPGSQRGFHCGGVLINKRYVLTAAHCVTGRDFPSSWSLTSVRLGEWDLSTEEDCDCDALCNAKPVDIPIEKKIPHESYDALSLEQHNDIALVMLARDVPFAAFSQPICLPVEDKTTSIDYDTRKFVVAGWGKTEKLLSSQKKHKTSFEGYAKQECENVYNYREINETEICAGMKGVGYCIGDSGGPLMARNERGTPPYWYVAGIASHVTPSCNEPDFKGVYTKVEKFISWIESTISRENQKIEAL